MSVLLSLLDEGTITSSTGKIVNAKNAIIIMTATWPEMRFKKV